MEVVARSVMTAARHGLRGRVMTSYWQHRPHLSLQKKRKPPSVSQIKDLLLENHDIVAEAIAQITIEEGQVKGYVKEEGRWYKFTIYKC